MSEETAKPETEEKPDFFEKIFGKKPEVGYEFYYLSFSIGRGAICFEWSCKGVGFGGYNLLFREDGFDLDTECMSDAFGIALLDEAVKRIDAGQKATKWKKLNLFELAKYKLLILFGKSHSFHGSMGYKEIESDEGHEDFIKHVALAFRHYIAKPSEETPAEETAK